MWEELFQRTLWSVCVWSWDRITSTIRKHVRNAGSQSHSDFLNQNLDFNKILKGLGFRLKKQLYRTVVLSLATYLSPWRSF